MTDIVKTALQRSCRWEKTGSNSEAPSHNLLCSSVLSQVKPVFPFTESTSFQDSVKNNKDCKDAILAKKNIWLTAKTDRISMETRIEKVFFSIRCNLAQVILLAELSECWSHVF